MNNEDHISRFVESFNIISKGMASLEYSEGDTGLSKLELMTLESLFKEQELTMSMLSKKMNISFSRATGIIDRLNEKMLVERKRDRTDRRVVRVTATEKGRKTAFGYQKQKCMISKKLMDILTHDEQRCFVSILEKIAEAIEHEKQHH